MIRRRQLAAGVAALLWGVAACAGRPAGAQPATPSPSRAAGRSTAALHDALHALFTHAAVDHAQWSVVVRSLTRGDVLYSLNPSRMMVPASNQKQLTAAAAAKKLGWDFRFTTRVVATGSVDGEGRLNGDLVVVGSGDPTINPRHPDRWAALDAWAAQIAARGVKVVGGNLVGDDDAFAEPGWGAGWSWEDLVSGYGAPVGALQYHENQVELTIGPGLEAGARAVVTVSPPGSGLVVDHRVTTVAADQSTRIALERVPGWTIVTVTGQIAAGTRPRTEYAAVENPTQLFLSAFREALSRNGVVLGGSTLDIDAVRERPDLASGETWITDQSAPLSEIVDVLLKWSRNGYGETLLWALSPPGEPATQSAGLRVLRETLQTLGLPPELYGAHDGSGLSRYDTVTADGLTLLLTSLWKDPIHKSPYQSALPLAGVSGSLESRMKDTPAAGRLWAKTGSMFNIRSLAGYVLTADDEPLVFAVLANNYRVPSSEIDAVIDKAAAVVAGWRRRE